VYDFPSEELTGGISISTPLVLGIQANLWTEAMHTAERVEFMTFPRLSALAESAWTDDNTKDFANFRMRMKNMEDIYHKSAVSYFDFNKPESAKEIAGPKL
jgi:hexosaminidase